MTVTYKETAFRTSTKIRVPVLHTVVYGHRDDIDGWNNLDIRVRCWCGENCKGMFYLHPGWTLEKFVQFEDDEDAVLFALAWAV